MNREQQAEAWRGRIALITGASSGIGAATARKLASEGLTVLLAARRQERLEALRAEIVSHGGSAHAYPVDLSEPAERQALFERVMHQFSALDVLVNNAGLGWYGYYEKMDFPTLHQMLQVNVAAVAEMSRFFLPGMRARNRGHIINIGSIAGELPNQGIALYAASKAFLNAFTTSLYRELKGSRVRVSVVRPGPVTTEFFDTAAGASAGRRIPAERFAIPPQAVADCVWRLLLHPRRAAYVPRGLSLTPWLEFSLGWLIDRLGPLLLKQRSGRQA